MISGVIFAIIGFGFLLCAGFYLYGPDSPFRTSESSSPTPSMLSKSPAILWMLETSIDPEFVETATTMAPLTQWSPKTDASVMYARLRDNLLGCREGDEHFLTYGNAMVHLCMQPVQIDSKLLKDSERLRIPEILHAKRHFIRNAFLAGRDAYHQYVHALGVDGRKKYRAGTRTALRKLLVHGLEESLVLPDDERLVWYGDLRWCHSDGRKPGHEEFDWLIDYLENITQFKMTGDDEIAGDVLLALSAMQALGTPAKRPSYIQSLIRCMNTTRPPRVRHTALKAAYAARRDLARATDYPEIDKKTPGDILSRSSNCRMFIS